MHDGTPPAGTSERRPRRGAAAKTRPSAAAAAASRDGGEHDVDVDVPQIKIARTDVRVVGMSPLIVHAWSEKAKRMIADKQQGAAKGAREKRDPEADYLASRYVDGEGHDCVQAHAFKSAIVDAASFSDGVTKVHLRGAVFIEGDLLPLAFDERVRREDMVRVGMGTADIRYRAEYRGWSVVLPIQFNANIVTPSQLVNLVNLAGFSIGVGDWRPQKDGQFGRFRVAIGE